MNLSDLSKEQLLTLIETIYLETRGFYADHDWPGNPGINDAIRVKYFDQAHRLICDILNWSQGKGIENILAATKQFEEMEKF